MSSYYDHIGPFFTFTGCAFVSIIVWIFNWICWRNNCCCCDFLHNPINKRIAWWFCFSFLLGMVACCISAFVSINRLGFALEGTRCAVDRIYYDTINGQLKTTKPLWEGFDDNKKLIEYLETFYIFVSEEDFSLKLADDGIIQLKKKEEEEEKIDTSLLSFKISYTKMALSLHLLYKMKDQKERLNRLETFFEDNNFDEIKDKFMKEFDHYATTGKAGLIITTKIYYSIFCIVIFFAGVCMILYACLKRQGHLLIFMHIIWNLLRFFIVSFFLYGTAYGIFFLVLRDVVTYVDYVFGQENLNDKRYLLPSESGSEFINFCLWENNTNFISTLDYSLRTSLNDFFTNYKEFMDLNPDKSGNGDVLIMKKNIIDITDDIKENMTEEVFNELVGRTVDKGGLFGSLDCGFLKDDLNQLKRAIYDGSVESRILCAVSLCSAFFGAVSVYFFLLVMHHYNNELNLDKILNKFPGFDGFQEKNKMNFKVKESVKKKSRIEVELDSLNDNSSKKNYNKTDYN